MSIQHIHVLIIMSSILLSLFFGFWTITHTSAILSLVSFTLAAFLVFYCVNFIKRVWSK